MRLVDSALRPRALDWRFLRTAGIHAGLATLFLLTSGRLAVAAWAGGWLGLDAQIYYRGSAAWLAGTSPWDALGYFMDLPAHYSALPTCVVLLAPFTLLPELVFTVSFIAASAAAAVYIVRRLDLPWYFVLFPPLYQGVQSGNPNVILFALLLCGRPVLEAIAPLLKVYAVIPLVGRRRWRSVGWILILGVPTLLAVPLWVDYISNFGTYAGRLMVESSGGYSATLIGPIAVIAALLGLVLLWLRDPESAAWVTVPTLWPASQLHYSIFAMPLLRERLWLAALLALPIPGMPALVPAAVVVDGYFRRHSRLRTVDNERTAGREIR